MRTDWNLWEFCCIKPEKLHGESAKFTALPIVNLIGSKLIQSGSLKLIETASTEQGQQEIHRYELVVPDRQSFLDFARRVGKALEHKHGGYNQPRVISGLADFLYLVVSIYAQKFNASVDKPSENL